MNAGNEKPEWFEEGSRLVTDQRQVEVARPRALRIERRAGLPAASRDGAAAQHDAGSLWNFLADYPAEFAKPIGIVTEGETEEVGAFLLVGEASLAIVLRLGRHQLGIAPIFCVSSGAMTFIITDPCITTKDTACVDVCPVDCIHPRKDEAEFADTPMLFIHPDECIDCGACVPACPVSAIYDSPDATPASQNDLIDANAKYRSGDPGAVAEAINLVNAHVSAHPELMNIPGT